MDAAGARETGALARAVETGAGEVIVFGVAPPRAERGPEKIAKIAGRTRDRLAAADVDAAVVYDLAEEKGRSDEDRPFDFSPTLDPATYVSDHLGDVGVPFVVYRNVGKYEEDDLRAWLAEQEPGAMTVFVGASSHDEAVRTTLPRAYEIRREERPDVLLGAIAIPERHAEKGDEPARLLRKQDAGCGFFVTQIVYDVDLALTMLTDYAAACRRDGVRPGVLVFTLAVCGSATQVDLLEWLGVRVPGDVGAELREAEDVLSVSARHCLRVASRLMEASRELGVPFGFAVESVSDLRRESDAAADLTHAVGDLLRR